MSLKGIAKETLAYLEQGEYLSESGKVVNFSKELQSAVDGTRLYTPDLLNSLLSEGEGGGRENTIIEVTDERTQVAAHRLVKDEGCQSLVLLNFASARNAGGGFLNGAKAQEEDLSRCSGLYPCLLTQPEYYSVNRSQSSLLYTDYMIYSPEVPWFRTRSRNILEEIFTASIITAPAPNAGQCLLRRQCNQEEINEVLYRRAGMVLALAKDKGHRELLLGAWGCGVFKNNPNTVADAFGSWLETPQFKDVFDRVTFAIFDSTREKNVLNAFKKRFQS